MVVSSAKVARPSNELADSQQWGRNHLRRPLVFALRGSNSTPHSKAQPVKLLSDELAAKPKRKQEKSKGETHGPVVLRNSMVSTGFLLETSSFRYATRPETHNWEAASQQCPNGQNRRRLA
jgi:hypothetical protein